jgi:Tfp pilus assembly protein PilF
MDDRTNTGRLLNNLGGLLFLLGKPEESVATLKQAFSVALDAGSDADAAQAMSSLAQVNLRTNRPAVAEAEARRALELLDDRVDYLDEIGNAQLVLGRALIEQDRFEEAERHLAASDDAFARNSLTSHRAAVWAAQADLAYRRGDNDSAVALYRRAVESLQDFRF